MYMYNCTCIFVCEYMKSKGKCKAGQKDLERVNMENKFILNGKFPLANFFLLSNHLIGFELQRG